MSHGRESEEIGVGVHARYLVVAVVDIQGEADGERWR